jgi:hypothetical protein
MAFHASDDGTDYVFLICARCATGLRKLPAGPRTKAINRAADAVLHDPGRYPHKAFADRDQASLFCRLAGDPVTAQGVVAECCNPMADLS